jgi:maltose alpha-D-glucosyltransferase/alpha-amylase
VELFGGMRFPPIGELPYFITLGPHTFYWFAIEPRALLQETIEISPRESQLPLLTIGGPLEALLRDKARADLEEILPEYLKVRRWFRGKARNIRSARIVEVIPVSNSSTGASITFVQVDYREGDPEIYLLPLASAVGEHAHRILKESADSVIARFRLEKGDEEGIIYEAAGEKSFCEVLLQAIARGRRLKGGRGELVTKPTRMFRPLLNSTEAPLEPSISKAEQSNTCVVFKDRFILKLFRCLEPGINPDLEIGRFLTERSFQHIPPVAGAIEYREGRGVPMTLGILHGFVPNQGDAWEYTQDVLGDYFEHVLARRRTEVEDVSGEHEHVLDLVERDFAPIVTEVIGPYLESARLLGQRTVELHIGLASVPDNPDFAPESFSKLYQRSLYQSMRNLSGEVFQLLRRSMEALSETVREDAQEILDREDDVFNHFQLILDRKISAMRIRCHGDYHLGQVLYTGKDFVIFDFEGEPAHPLSERRIKRSPLRDVAGMLRSFHYAAYSALFTQQAAGLIREEDLVHVEAWAHFWYLWVCVAFLKAYLPAAAQERIVPQSRDELQVLLGAYLLEKAVYELGYELNNRPDWVRIPLRGIRQQLKWEEAAY